MSGGGDSLSKETCVARRTARGYCSSNSSSSSRGETREPQAEEHRAQENPLEAARNSLILHPLDQERHRKTITQAEEEE